MKNIVLTGLPGVGKTSLIIKLSEIFKEFNPVGFYTSEIIEDYVRAGFELVSLSGDTRLFAHIAIKSKHSVGKYKIDLKGFDEFLGNVFLGGKKTGFYVIDEIGKMECKSRKFSKLIVELLDSDRLVIASIAERGTGLITDVRKRDDIMLYEVTPENRDLILKDLTMKIRDLLLE